MIGDDISPRSGRAACRFGIVRLKPLFTAFVQEIEGVKRGEDIEHVHRMRVASRRLRAALPLFSSCFPEKKYRRWAAEIRTITRALGKARDADVQIDFLQKYAISRKPSAPGCIPLPQSDPVTAEVQALLAHLRDRRNALQAQVAAALSRLESSGVLEEMHDAFRTGTRSGPRIRQREMAAGIPAVAAERIGRRLEQFLSHEPWLPDPEAIARHHAMRIAAKKLRYTMEVYSPVFRRGLGKPLARVKKVQEILGEIHDCDVWINRLTRILVKERSRPVHPATGTGCTPSHTLAGLKVLIADREKKRGFLHRRMLNYWEMLTCSGEWGGLRTILIDGRKMAYRLPDPADEASARRMVLSLIADHPACASHARQVTRHALMLYDTLADLHDGDGRGRFLLECAGMLHGIGSEDGGRSCGSRSSRIIRTAECLPFDLRERVVIAITVRGYRESERFGTDVLYTLLPEEDRRLIRMLSAILLIADSLDYRHQDAVTALHCTVRPGEVICGIDGLQDTSGEKARARAAAPLFEEVFERRLFLQ